MSTPEAAPDTPTFRRGWLRRGGLALVILSGWATAAAAAVWAIGTLFGDAPWYQRLTDAVGLAALALFSVGNSQLLRRWSRHWAGNRLTVAVDGLHGHLGGAPFDLTWRDLRAIHHTSRHPEGYQLDTRNGHLAFSVLDLPAPRRIARLISQRSGLPIT